MADELRDALSEAFDKVEESNAQPEAAETPRAEPEATEGTEAAEATERARDEQGRFTAAEKAAEADGKDKSRQTLTLKGKPNAAKEPGAGDNRGNQAGNAEVLPQAAKGAEAQNQGVIQGAQEPAAGNGQVQGQQPLPPAHWLGAAKKHWARLPAEVRESIHQDAQQHGQAAGLTQALTPYSQILTQEFGGADRGLTAILGTWQFARTQPLDFVKQFLQHRNIDPRMLAGEASPAPQQNVEADAIPAPVLQRMQQLEAAVQHMQQQPLVAQQHQIQSEVETFGNAVNPDGSVAHPYFNDARPTMAALMGSGQAKTLQEAYDMACYASPKIRADLLAADSARQAEERRRAAEAAKGAAVSVAGSPGHRGPGQAQNETVGQSLNRVFDQLASGGRA